MKSEYTKEELKKGVRNPYYHMLCKDVTVGVANEDYDSSKITDTGRI